MFFFPSSFLVGVGSLFVVFNKLWICSWFEPIFLSWLNPEFKAILSNFSGNSAFVCLFLPHKFLTSLVFHYFDAFSYSSCSTDLLVLICRQLNFHYEPICWDTYQQWMPLTWSLVVDHLSLKSFTSLEQSSTSKLISSVHSSPYCSSSPWSRPINSSLISSSYLHIFISSSTPLT